MKVMLIHFIIGVLSTVAKCLVQGMEDLEIRERVETIETIALLRSDRILRIVMETLEDCHSDSSGKPSANAGVENSQIIIIPKNGFVIKLVTTKQREFATIQYFAKKLF